MGKVIDFPERGPEDDVVLRRGVAEFARSLELFLRKMEEAEGNDVNGWRNSEPTWLFHMLMAHQIDLYDSLHSRGDPVLASLGAASVAFMLFDAVTYQEGKS